MNFADRLDLAARRTGNPCTVGIDPHPALLPEPFAGVRDARLPRSERARLLGDFCCELVELAAGRVPAVKPQSAFFELFGADGALAWERTVAAARAAGLLVIGDVKRGDIDSTAAAYASAFLDPSATPAPCDAVTLSPFLGGDSIAPFLEACARHGAGVFVLVRTSNPGGADFQHHGEPALSLAIADAVHAWGAELVGECGLSSVGAVVGATQPSELCELRARMPRTPFLLPGYGAQGAGPADVVDAFLPVTARGSGEARRGALVNSSRGIAFAYKSPRYAGRHWKDAARAALDEMVAALGSALADRA